MFQNGEILTPDSQERARAAIDDLIARAERRKREGKLTENLANANISQLEEIKRKNRLKREDIRTLKRIEEAINRDLHNPVLIEPDSFETKGSERRQKKRERTEQKIEDNKLEARRRKAERKRKSAEEKKNTSKKGKGWLQRYGTAADNIGKVGSFGLGVAGYLTMPSHFYTGLPFLLETGGAGLLFLGLYMDAKYGIKWLLKNNLTNTRFFF
jgi:hypothetical protein